MGMLFVQEGNLVQPTPSHTGSLTQLSHVWRKWGIFSSADSRRGHMVLWVWLLTVRLQNVAPASIFALITALLMSRGSSEEASQIRCSRLASWVPFRKHIDDIAPASSSISLFHCCWEALFTSVFHVSFVVWDSTTSIPGGRPYL